MRAAAAVQSRDDLINRHLYLVAATARLARSRMPPKIEIDDLEAEGYVGLCDAASKFDASRGIKFSTYAITKIRGAIFEYLRLQMWAPRTVQDNARRIKGIVNLFAVQAGRAPTDEEIAAILGVTVERLDKWLFEISRCKMLSMQWIMYPGGDQERSEFVADRSDGPEKTAEKREMSDALTSAVARLPERERDLMDLYYTQGMTFKAIGAEWGISESRAYQLHGQGVERLRGYLRADAEMFEGG